MPELRTAPVPDGLRYLLDAFHEIAAGRQAGFGSPAPLQWAEIEAWARLTRTPLAGWEVRVLRALDQAWINAWGAAQAAASPKATPAPRS